MEDLNKVLKDVVELIDSNWNLHFEIFRIWSQLEADKNFALREYIERQQREAEQQELAMIDLRIEVDRLSTAFRTEMRDNERFHGIRSELEREVERLRLYLSSLRSSTRTRSSNDRHR